MNTDNDELEVLIAEPTIEINSTDATRGQGLSFRVETRKRELETTLSTLEDGDHSRKHVEYALAAIDSMLSGDLAHIPAVIAVQLNRWLETNKHVAEAAR